jgi:NAD+--dinitrogen-reductase ADP-D-ribosyltransferase
MKSMYHANIAGDFSRSSCSLNRCNLPPRIIGSEEFQANPQPLEIDGARALNPSLFNRLEAMKDVDERSDFFHEYLRSQFSLDEQIVRDGKARPVYSYIHLLRAWGADSNGQAGALLKSWVETRFGLLATYHKGRLADDADSRMAFMQDRTRGSARFIGVLMQMDLLYTFCQDELRKRFPNERWKTLYRGTHDSEEYAIRSRNGETASDDPRSMLVQLNNLSSFSSDPEVAWEFGSSAWEVQAPFSKIVFFSGLLPKSVLAGESEFLILGGFYKVRAMVC